VCAKLTYDAGWRYDTPGLLWDGDAPSTPKKMPITKAVIDFTPYTAADLAPIAQQIHDKMTLNAATFPAPPTTMAALQTLVTTFSTKLAAKASRATADIIAFNVARHDLEVALGHLGNYVNTVANGDPVIVEKSGFPSYQTGQPADPTPPAAPSDLRLRAGDLSGEIVARYRPAREKSFNEVQKCTGDPAVEANWEHAAMVGGGKATIGSLTPGALIWIRVRTCGLKGVMGAWSDPAQIRVV
jgi:hypothetical protein